jgi:hypothetical protein
MSILTPAAPSRGFRPWRRRATQGLRDADASRRATGLLGLLILVLAGTGIALASLPSTYSPGQIAAHVAENRAAVLVAHTFDIAAALLFFFFAARLARSVGVADSGAMAWTGWGIAAAAMASAIAAVAIAVLASPQDIEAVRDLISLRIGLQVLVALAIASFAGAVAFNDSNLPALVRLAGGVTAVLAVGTAFAGWAQTPTTMQTVTPIAFLVFIGLLAAWLLFGREVDRAGRG